MLDVFEWYQALGRAFLRLSREASMQSFAGIQRYIGCCFALLCFPLLLNRARLWKQVDSVGQRRGRDFGTRGGFRLAGFKTRASTTRDHPSRNSHLEPVNGQQLSCFPCPRPFKGPSQGLKSTQIDALLPAAAAHSDWGRRAANGGGQAGPASVHRF